MTWIKVHDTLADHPKVIRLASHLGIPDYAAEGLIVRLWCWALKYADDGDLSEYDAQDLAYAVRWDGDPARFYESLHQVRLLDSDHHIHDWDEYAGELLDKRADAAERQRRRRARLKATLILTDSVEQEADPGVPPPEPAPDPAPEPVDTPAHVTRDVTRDDAVTYAVRTPPRVEYNRVEQSTVSQSRSSPVELIHSTGESERQDLGDPRSRAPVRGPDPGGDIGLEATTGAPAPAPAAYLRLLTTGPPPEGDADETAWWERQVARRADRELLDPAVLLALIDVEGETERWHNLDNPKLAGIGGWRNWMLKALDFAVRDLKQEKSGTKGGVTPYVKRTAAPERRAAAGPGEAAGLNGADAAAGARPDHAATIAAALADPLSGVGRALRSRSAPAGVRPVLRDGSDLPPPGG